MGETMIPFDVSRGHVGTDEYDLAKQTLISHHYWISDGVAKTFDSTHRYAWPAEYDPIARIAGLTLVERWADWYRVEYTSESTSHVSVWKKLDYQ